MQMQKHENLFAKICTAQRKSASSFPIVPWTAKQHRLFEAAAHNPQVAKRTGIPQAKAAEMAHEGVKQDAKKKLSAALRSR